jgi:nitroimidazol reductase NimA-like FMN-containing flavoprotein (pyridoxamine 5'-phosphate oxidase superfamily)
MKVTKADRKNRGIGLEAITITLKETAVGRVATISPDGYPYVVPVFFVFDGDKVYFHCAGEGKKLENLKANPSVCFEADDLILVDVSPTNPCTGTVYYRSVIATGKASLIGGEEKVRALWMLADKYSGGKATGEMSHESIDETCVVRIDIDEISGKAHLPGGK